VIQLVDPLAFQRKKSLLHALFQPKRIKAQGAENKNNKIAQIDK
jgi:hypothetical protein